MDEELKNSVLKLKKKGRKGLINFMYDYGSSYDWVWCLYCEEFRICYQSCEVFRYPGGRFTSV